jgi:enterochelin esterase-like enzyme
MKTCFRWFIIGFIHISAQINAQNMSVITEEKTEIDSKHLNRKVYLTLLLPQNHAQSEVLLLNDGQDIPSLGLQETLQKLISEQQIKSLTVVGIHANENRLQEYGTAAQADYAGRGGMAKNYTAFVLNELLPFLRKKYKLSTERENLSFTGFSLGGLSALDIVWANDSIFKQVGVFSGSLWWRQKAFENGYDEDNDRIMHNLIKNAKEKKALRFWFEVGTEDEKEDRNNNGIIDAIDDTVDLIKALKARGISSESIKYEEIKGGQHNQQTWAKIMPEFLKWGFRK